ncbi:MAG: NAD(P)H-dependent oxidoreductase [Balneolaceae bacterium]|nr:NAD(P)H-dependent oxidoreductase [Balneolaceae bacterium]
MYYVSQEYLKQKYDELDDLSAGIINLQDFSTKTIAGGKYGMDTPEAVISFFQPLMNADGLVVVCPEYNGGYPGILKLFIDYLPFRNQWIKSLSLL